MTQEVESSDLELASDPNTPVDVLVTLSSSNSTDVRAAVAANWSTPEAILESLASDPKSKVKSYLAVNPNASISLLTELLHQHYKSQTGAYLWAGAAAWHLWANPTFPKSSLPEWYGEGTSAYDFDEFEFAMDPDTHPALLEFIFKKSDHGQGVFGGSGDFVEIALANNPGTPLWCLEKLDSLIAVAANLKTPASLLEQIAPDISDDYVDSSCLRSEIARNPNTPKSLLHELFQISLIHPDRDEGASLEIRAGLAANSNLPIDMLVKLSVDRSAIQEFHQHGESYDRHDAPAIRTFHPGSLIVLEGIAGNPCTAPNMLEIFATDEDSRVRNIVANNPNTPVSILEKLVTKRNRNVRVAVASNSNTPAAILEKLASEEDHDVRKAICSNPNTPAAILEKLATDSLAKNNIAEDSNTSDAQLEKLANRNVSVAVASNPNTPAAILEKLASEEDLGLREAVSGNPNLPLTALEGLMKLPVHLWEAREWEQKRASAVYLNTAPIKLEELSTDEDMFVRNLVASNLNTPTIILENLSIDEEVEVRMAVAGNLNTPAAILEILSLDEEIEVREYVSSNLNTPPGILAQLAADEDIAVRTAVFYNPKVSDEIRVICGLLGITKEHPDSIFVANIEFLRRKFNKG